MRPDRTFRRNFFVIAMLHVAFVVGVYVFSAWRPQPAEQVIWLEGGSIGGGETGEIAAAAESPAPPAPEPVPEPPPLETKPQPAPPPPPLEPPAPSEIVTPKATPEPSTPKPSTPKPETPKPTTPKPATPKPTPKITPKPKPKPATPKAPPKRDGDASPKPKSSPGEKPNITPGTAKTEGAAAGSKPGSTGSNGPGAGNGKGPGKAGSGTGASEFGWYFSMIHDRFHNRWEQPTSIIRGAQDFVTTLKIRISKDGTVLSREIVRSSGDTLMDESVMAAGEKVQQIDPLPDGLGDGNIFEVNVAFKLDQGL